MSASLPPLLTLSASPIHPLTLPEEVVVRRKCD